MSTALQLSITGFVGSAPEIRQVGDQTVATFSVALNRRRADGERDTLWLRVNCWNRLSEIAEDYLRTGSLVQVTAEWIRPSAYISRSTGEPVASLDITAGRLVLLDRAPAQPEPEPPMSRRPASNDRRNDSRPTDNGHTNGSRRPTSNGRANGSRRSQTPQPDDERYEPAPIGDIPF